MFRILNINPIFQGTTAPSYQVILRCIDGNPVKPRIELTVSPKLWQCPVRLDKRFLRNIHYLFRILYVSTNQLNKPVLVPEHKNIECFFVTILYPPDQFLINWLLHPANPLEFD
jgi:hypothetical protein